MSETVKITYSEETTYMSQEYTNKMPKNAKISHLSLQIELIGNNINISNLRF